MKRLFINLGVVFGTLIVFGLFKVPFEVKTEEVMREEGLLPPNIELTDRNRIGQAGYAAALGGLRDVLATYNYLKAYNQYAKNDTYEMEQTLNTVVTLQPRSDFYWEMACYYLAYNTFSNIRDDQSLAPIQRHNMSQEFLAKGLEYLHRGIAIIPGSYRIGMEMMRLYSDSYRYPNYEKAVAAGEMLMRDGVLDANQTLLAWGEYVYNLALVPGREHDAYSEAVKLYKVSNLLQRVRTQRVLIYILQDVLMIPEEQRIPEEELLFDGEILVNLGSLSRYAKRVEISEEDAVRYLWQGQVRTWKTSSAIRKDDFVRAKLHVLQQALELTDEEKISDEELFDSEQHKQYIEQMIQYEAFVETVDDPKRVHAQLAQIVKSGKATQTQKDLVVLLQYRYEDKIPEADRLPDARLLFNERQRNKELRYYLDAREGKMQNMALGDMVGLQALPIGNLLEQVVELEEKLDIPDSERIEPLQTFSDKAYAR